MDQGGSYTNGSAPSSYNGIPGGPASPTQQQQQQQPAATLRRRANPTVNSNSSNNAPSRSSSSSSFKNHSVVQKMDFMFPKVDHDFTIQTDRGGNLSVVAYILIVVLMLAETTHWAGQNRMTSEHIAVDTSLGKRMRVNINITFPALACDDLHVDAMDVAGDSQINVEDTLVKRKLHITDGQPLSAEEIRVETNAHRQQQETKERLAKEGLPENYCGPCYGAQEKEDQCCNTCDDIMEAYTNKKWRTDALYLTAEQCIREGRSNHRNGEPKLMTKGQGCLLSGYMTVNRVAGNFHIAMGEGIERNGRHIHTFVPEDAPNFNASHIIHELSFGPPNGDDIQGMNKDGSPLNSVSKIVKEEHGTTGLFQYFIKVVPTNYNMESTDSINSNILETNRYFFTERFRPLMGEEILDHNSDNAEGPDSVDEQGRKIAHAGHAGGHSNKDHHRIQNSVLPGVFFIYEIYPFAVEISQNSVPFTHLLIRLMATIGGIFTIVKLVDTFLEDQERRRGR